MPRFRYAAFSIDGRPFAGETPALDAAALAADLAARELVLVSFERLGEPAKNLFAPTIGDAAVTGFIGELAFMLRSGMPLDEALDLAARGAPRALARIVSDVRRDLLAGTSFVQALESHPTLFTRDIIALVRIADVTGDLEGVLTAIAAQRQRARHLREKVSGALRYPAFLTISAIGVLVFFLLNVIPQFAGLFADSGNDPGVLVRVVLALSGWLVENVLSLAIGLALTLALGFFAWRTPLARKTMVGFLLRLPVVRGLWLSWRTARFLSNFGVLLQQGVPMNQALAVLEDVVGSDSRAALAAVGDAVRRGERLHGALARSGLFSDVALRMLRIGEETGELAKVTTEAGALFAKKLEERLEKVTGLVGPIAILTIALMIGGLMVTIMTALVSVNQSIL